MAGKPTLARGYGSVVVHHLNRGASTWRTMCWRDATLMADFPLPSCRAANATSASAPGVAEVVRRRAIAERDVT